MAYMTPRQWLQRQVDTHKDAETRRQAQAALNVVGDNWKIDQRFLNQDKYNSPGVEHKRAGGSNPFNPGNYANYSNGYSAYEVNRLINPQMQKMYDADKAIWEKGQQQNGSSTGPAIVPQYDPYTEQRARQAREDAKNRAFLDQSLNRFDSYFGDADRSHDIRLQNINNSYNQSLNSTNKAWGRAQEDYNTATNNRLRNRQRQLGVADDDFKKQRDAYDRYFARMGAGSSSAAQYAVPTLLARAASKVRNEIEDTNAENEREQTVSFNRAREDHEENLANLGRTRQSELDRANSDWNSTRSGLLEKKAQLQQQRDLVAGKNHNQVIRDSQGLLNEADRLRRESINQQAVKPEFQVKAVGYKPTIDKDWSYKSTETKVDNPADDKEQQDDAYNRYFRDREEEKKRKGWIPALG